MSVVTGLDHAIIAVNDLAAGVAAMGRLGFLTTPPAAHSEHKGTENTTIVFRDRTYVELMALRTPTPANARLRADLDSGRALHGLALATEDAAVTATAWRDAGVGTAEGLSAFSRPVELPGGPQEAAFRTCATDAPGPLVFACEHRTPDLVWRPDHLDHPNAVVGLQRVAAAARDLDGFARLWRRIAPEAAQDRQAEELVIHLGATELAVLTPELYAAVYGPVPPSDPGLGALVFRTADLARTRAALAGVATRETAAGVEVGPADGLGAALIFAP